MVRVGDWEMRLVRTGTGEPYPEVQQQGGAGTTFAVAAPGQGFEVQVIQRPSRYATTASTHIVTLCVDEQGVGFHKIFDMPRTSNFQGFLKAGDAQCAAYQGFLFRKPQETKAKQAHNLDFQKGKIVCKVVYVAEPTGEVSRQHRVGPADTNETVAKLPEGKKFFMAPSLTSGRGELKLRRGFSKTKYKTAGRAVAVLELRYETETAAEGQDENAAGPSRWRGAPAAAAAVKQEGGARKRQRQQEEELIDLSKAPNENDEVLAAKKANKVLECDLTADDEPAWRAVKKEVHRVE